jgi:hypothetical protein
MMTSQHQFALLYPTWRLDLTDLGHSVVAMIELGITASVMKEVALTSD